MPRKFGRIGAVLLAGLLIALLAYGLTTTSSDDTIDQTLAAGRAAQAPAFDLELLEAGKVPPILERRLSAARTDRKISITELRGTAVVLNYWASWCAPCAQEARVLEETWKRRGNQGVLFIGLDMQDLREDARAFLTRHEVDYPNLRDPGKKVARSYGATGIPETYFITRQGTVVAHCVGVVSRKQLETGIAAALARKPLSRCRGGALRPSR